jgi:hypothetical protein
VGRRRAGLLIGAVAGLARRRPRSLRVLVRTVHGSVRNVVVTVRGRCGRVEGRSRLPRTFSGRRRFAVRLRRGLPRGRYVIQAVGRRPDGSRVRVAKRVRQSR